MIDGPPVASPQGDGDPGDENTVLADGFEQALLGYGRHSAAIVAVYDWEQCVAILQTRDRMTLDEAEEFLDVNVVGSGLGPYTLVFLHRVTPAQDSDAPHR